MADTEAQGPSRANLARSAAERLLFGFRPHIGYGALDSTAVPPPSASHIPRKDWRCCRSTRGCCRCLRAMTPARRTFCLIVAFDLLLAFILWGIHVNTRSNNSIVNNFIDEVVHYNVKHSLFDALICSIVRFIPLTLAYAICRLRNPSVIAFTTFVTCSFVIVKIFCFSFGSDSIAYLLLIEEFVIAWIETWLLDFKVLPQEHDTDSLTSRQRDTGSLGGGEFLTPEEGSPEEPASPLEPPSSYEDAQLRSTATENWRRASRIIELEDGWKTESLTEDGIRVYSRQFEKLGTVLRIEARVEATPSEVFKVTSLDYEHSPQWNKTIIDCRVLQVLGPDSDVTYNVTAPAGGGVVSSRDFVTVRHWHDLPDGTRLSAACAVEHPRRPVDPRYVRGLNRLSAFVYRGSGPPAGGPGACGPSCCQLGMYVSTDIKGWIPQVVVDQALTGVLVEFVRCLRRRVSEVRNYQGLVDLV